MAGDEAEEIDRPELRAGELVQRDDAAALDARRPAVVGEAGLELALAQALDVAELIQIGLQYVPLQVERAASALANDVDEAGQRQFANMVRHRLAFDVVQRHQVAERDLASVLGDLLENIHTTRLRQHLGHVGKLLCGKPVL